MRTQLAVCSLIVALVGASVAGPAAAQGRGRARGQSDKPKQEQKQDRNEVREDVREAREEARDVRNGFPARDRDIISRYYAGLPPGLAKRKGDLPPGLEKQVKQVERNGTLPPGLQKKLLPFPADLRRQLGALPAGYSRAIVDNDVIVYRTSTRQIVDVIYDIVR